MPRYTDETIRQAKLLYLQNYNAEEIKNALSINSLRVVYQWIEKNNWNDLRSHESVQLSASQRLNALIDMPDKNDGQLREIEILGDLLLKLEKAESIKRGEYRPARNQHTGPVEGKNKRKKVKNDISDLNEDDFAEAAEEIFGNYGHQQVWREINLDETIRRRFILKSRQIGATFYFAFEAFEKAVLTGTNQIFISASKRQSEIFRAYIVAYAKKRFDIDLTGNPITLHKDGEPWANLFFLATNIATAQGENGDVYFDEAFWTRDFDTLYELASPMASQTPYKTTIFSTPSTLSHSAYKYFSGEKYNEGRPKNEHITVDISHKALKAGYYCEADMTWRQIVTIHDAAEGGYDRFDIDYLRATTTPQRFKNLYECEFIDDANSVFNLEELLSCAVDSADWKSYDKDAPRPFGNHPVLIGYDPSRINDKAEVAVLSQPNGNAEPFRMLERVSMVNTSGQKQAAVIQRMVEEKYSVAHIGIDKTGPGVFVADLVEEFYPNLTPIIYSPDMKTRLVEKARDVIHSKRFEYDIDEMDVALAFLSIRQTTTRGQQITYIADRSDAVGHGDIAWAIMHAMIYEPLAVASQKKTMIVFSE